MPTKFTGIDGMSQITFSMLLFQGLQFEFLQSSPQRVSCKGRAGLTEPVGGQVNCLG